MDDISEEVSEYEKLRLKRIEENRRCLQELGFGLVSNVPVSNAQSTSSTPKSAKKRRQSSTAAFVPVRRIVTRRSVQLGEQYPQEHELNDDDEESASPKKKREYRDNFYGAVPGVKVGHSWEYRLDCSLAGVHRPTVAGIHGGPDGAYSIALSGGYEDDVDFGYNFTYTGSGGRDLKGTKTNPKNLRTAPQSKDQSADGYNAALIASVETQNPVRVIRGYKLKSTYAPESGYRYDGLYTVDKYWTEIGLSGFLVYKFKLSRMEGQDPPIWELEANQENNLEHSNHQSMQINNGTSPKNVKVGSPQKNVSVNSPMKVVKGDKFNPSGDLTPSNLMNGSVKASPSKTQESNSTSTNLETLQNGKKTETSPSKQGGASKKLSISPFKICEGMTKPLNSPIKKRQVVVVKCSNSPVKNGVISMLARSPSGRFCSQKSPSPKKKIMVVSIKSPNTNSSPVKKLAVSNINGSFDPSNITGSPPKTDLQNGGTSSPQMKTSPVVIYRSILPRGMKSPLTNGAVMQIGIKEVKSSQHVSSPSKTESLKKDSDRNISHQSDSDVKAKAGSPREVDSLKLTSPAKQNTVNECPESSKKAPEETKELSEKSPTISKISPVTASKPLRRDLFSRNCNIAKSPSKNSSPAEPSSKVNSPSQKAVSRAMVKSSPKSPSTSLDSSKMINGGAVKKSPQSSASSESSSGSIKSPKSSSQKRSKPSNTLERYFIKKFASNDLSRAYRPDFSRSPNAKNNCDSDDDSIPAFIGFNEITINNSRNRLKLLTDMVPLIIKKPSVRTKLNPAKRLKKTEEVAKCSSSKREYIASVDKIRDLSSKISNMSNFDPNAGFIPECFIKCSKIDSNESDSSDDESSSSDAETFGVKNVCSSESSSGFSDCPLPTKGLSPQKLLDLISSDEENEDEPFLGFQDVSTRSIIRNAFLVHKYAKIIDKN